MVVLDFLGDKFHRRPFQDIHVATLKLSAQVKRNKLYPFPGYHSSLDYTGLNWSFQNFLTISLFYSPLLSIFHLESTSFAEAQRQLINVKPLSATVLK